jgi:hypothetical protein
MQNKKANKKSSNLQLLNDDLRRYQSEALDQLRHFQLQTEN